MFDQPFAPRHDLRINAQKSVANSAHESKIRLPAVAREIVKENAADAARLLPVGKIKVPVTPFLELPVGPRPVGIACPSQGLVKGAGVLVERERGGEI